MGEVLVAHQQWYATNTLVSVLCTTKCVWIAHIHVDKKVVDDVSFEDIPYILMAAFFVYKICYPY